MALTDYRKPYTGIPSSIPKTPTNTSWGWNQSNPLGTTYQQPKAPATGMSSTDYPSLSSLVKAPAPAQGVSYEPPKTENFSTATPSPFGQRTINTQTGDAFVDGTKTGTTALPSLSELAVPTPMPKPQTAQVDGMTYIKDDAAKTAAAMPPMPEFQAPDYGPGYTPGAFETMYGTLGNIQDYMNPYLDKIIERGNKNILASASARGLLGSTGTENQLGEWATQAQADAFNDAFGRFNQDRGYMTDVYRDGRDFDYGNFRDTNKWNYGLFQDEKADYEKRLSEWFKQLSGVTDVGIDASNKAGDLSIEQAKAIAALFGEGGNIDASKIMSMSKRQQGLLGTFIGAILGGV